MTASEANDAETVSALPSRIGGFRILRQLGEGGMGAVYLGLDATGQQVAIKVLRPDLARDPDFRLRFLREVAVAGKVQHPNVVAIRGSGEDGGQYYLALEYLDGGDLHELVTRRKVLTPHKALSMLREAAAGVAAMHAAGLVHRDIKPANIFLARDGRVVLGDLGLARSEEGADRMTLTGTAMGTPAYMSPEHVRGEADLDVRTDLYALGALYYHLLTGRQPYTGETSYVITHKVLTEPVPDPRRIDPAIEAEAVGIIFKAMAKDRGERYQTPEELLADIDCALHGRPLLHAVCPRPPARLDIEGPIAATCRPGLRLPDLSPSLARLVLIGLLLAGGAWFLSRLPTWLEVPADPAGTVTTDRPAWASAAGRDGFGLWADLTVGPASLRLRHVGAGKYIQGSPSAEPGHEKGEEQRTVIIGHDFWLSTTEVPQALYQEVMKTNPSVVPDPQRPVEQVRWSQAQDFVRTLSDRCGATVVLPSEAQWEYACRAGGQGAWANEPLGEYAITAPPALETLWLEQCASGRETGAVERYYKEHRQDPLLSPRRCASLRPNAWGLFDLHGNVAEWCQDAGQPGTARSTAEVTDPVVTTGTHRVVKGGSWYDHPRSCRSSARLLMMHEAAHPSVGFRVVIHD